MQNSKSSSIFISYGREDADAARRLTADLSRAGLDLWLDLDRLRPGERWRSAIQTAIKGSRYFIALLSSRCVDRRGFVHKEMVDALDELGKYPESHIYLIPVRLDLCQPSHQQLEELQWIDMFPDWSVGLQKLLTAFAEAEPPGSGSVSTHDRQPPLSPLQLSDVQTVPDMESKTCTLDFRVFNRGSSEVLINRVNLRVVDLAEIHTFGFMEF